tara:strand:+ start:5548 stop:5742 length:195 start_codon:yes stop_codon:yes gene_type:complete
MDKIMIEDYSTKDMRAPVVKEEFTLPEGWTMVEKRGRWCVRRPDGQLRKFANKKAAKLYIEEIS